jgi:tRNA threonylcarbamoyl adenosine modification protein (Sua5/YciO/YrdC/YwlC family)
MTIDVSRWGVLSTRQLNHVTKVLRDGGVIAYPSDTVYAIGCVIGSRQAMDRIYKARQMRDYIKLAVLCESVSVASSYAHFSQDAFRLAKRLFPGPYTLVLPATSEVPRLLLERKRRKVGIRITDHGIPLSLIGAVGGPLLTSSALAPGTDEPCVDADDVENAFSRFVDIIIDGGPTGALPSTVLEMNEDGEISVLREGLGPISPAF